MKQAKLLIQNSLALGLLGLGVVGCGKNEEIKVYTTPKEVNTHLTMTGGTDSGRDPHAHAPTGVPAAPKVNWKTPSNWTELAPTSMRVGNFSITKGDQKAEMAILPFPGSVGGELENVNRWRGEIGLEPVKEGGFTSETVQIGSETGKLFDLQGPKLSTIAAMLERDGTSWFFKMRGDKELVAENKSVLVDFLKTVSFPAAAAAKPATASYHDEDDGEDHSGHDHGPKWDIPAHWKVGGQKPMVLKNWDITGQGDATANMAISSFPGEVGGVVANVNRWRGQLNLPEITTAQVKDAIQVLETTDGHSQAAVVDFKGTDRTGKPTRLIAAIVPHGGDTWFYKLTGDDALIEREKAAFLKLVQTARFH